MQPANQMGTSTTTIFHVLALLAGAGVVRAQPVAPKLKVAVVPSLAVNLEPARVDALTQDLADALDAELIVDAIGGLEVRRLIRADLPPDCASTPSCAAEVAKATGATQLLFVVVVDSGASGSIQVDAMWVEPSSGKTASRPAIDVTSTIGSDAKARFQTAATSLLPDAPPRPKPKTDRAVSINGQFVGGVPRHVTTLAMITAGATVVGLGAGLAFGLSARRRYNTCEASLFTCTRDQKATIHHFDYAADTGWVIMIGAAVATGILYMTSSEAPHVIVTPTPEGVAATAFGRF
jgi:hypothetical protein